MSSSPSSTRQARPLVVLALLALAACLADGPPYFIPGSAELPECSEPPAADLAGRRYSDSGTVTITSAGCGDAQAGERIESCALTWNVLSQVDHDVELLVDDEYTLRGRLCGDRLHLRGGWWLPVVDGDFGCTYEDDSADEVGIEADGSVLTVESPDRLSGVLSVRGSCTGTYDARFDAF